MAKPPAPVSRTYQAAGQWQLRLLSARASFQCVNCRRVMTARHVATRNADWAQTVCRGCYGFLTRTQPGNPKTASKAKPGAVQASQAPRNARRNTRADEHARVAAMREEQLHRQLPGVGRLLEFFRSAGIRVEVGKRGSLRINNRQTRPLTWMLPSPTAVDWDHFIDLIACEYAADVFLRAVTNNARFGDGLRAFLRPNERGFAIMRGGVRLGVIRPTCAHVRYREGIYGNFLTPGAHWQRVAGVLHDAEAELLTEWKRDQEARTAAEAAAAQAEAQRRRAATRRRIDHLPDDLAPSLAAACLDASRRIRFERQVAYERPVVLEGDHGKLTLLPIVGPYAGLRVPFRLSNGTQMVRGELLLGDNDPLSLLVDEEVAHEDAIMAWTCVLLGFADATCIDPEPKDPARQRQQAQPGQHLQAASRRVSATQSMPRHRQWPRHLDPIGPWTRYSGSFVGGHRRRLVDGQTASAEACDRARQVGIILHTSETWVRPHTRGVPDDVEMRFLWHAPKELGHAANSARLTLLVSAASYVSSSTLGCERSSPGQTSFRIFSRLAARSGGEHVSSQRARNSGARLGCSFLSLAPNRRLCGQVWGVRVVGAT